MDKGALLARRAHHRCSSEKRSGGHGTLRLCPPYEGEAHTAFTLTFNPSFGFGIGHICQSGV